MKRTALVLAFIFWFLLLALITTNQPKLVTANFFIGLPPEPAPIGVALETPTNGTTYLCDDISLVFSINTTLGDVVAESVVYILDGQEASVPLYSFNHSKYVTTITGLRDGWHSLSVKVTGRSLYDTDPSETHWNVKGETVTDSKSIIFFVDAAPPSIGVFSPRSENYTTAEVALNFTLSKSVEFITYSLDGKENITITGNITLTGLANGSHNLTIYAKDEAGHVGASETMYFNVQVQEPLSTALVLPVFIAAVGVVLAGAASLVYFKKRKRQG